MSLIASSNGSEGSESSREIVYGNRTAGKYAIAPRLSIWNNGIAKWNEDESWRLPRCRRRIAELRHRARWGGAWDWRSVKRMPFMIAYCTACLTARWK